MANGDTRTNQYLEAVANGDSLSASCCETRSQTLIRGIGDRITNIEEEVEEIKANPDVVDIVGTYADLQAYDTSKLTDKDVVRVLADETHNGESTYYRYTVSPSGWTYVGSTGEKPVQSDWNENDSTKLAYVKNRPFYTDGGVVHKLNAGYIPIDGSTIVVNTNGDLESPITGTFDFEQLNNRPSYGGSAMTGSTNIPTVNDATLTVTQNGVSAGTFTANSANNATIALTDTTYSSFTGTDGTTAGTSGLVPAPATTDADKFLKSDGTWDEAGSSVNVVQTTGTSQTDVMSQYATTLMVYDDPNYRYRIRLGSGASVGLGSSIAIGSSAKGGNWGGIAIGYGAEAQQYSVALGVDTKVRASSGDDVAIGHGADVSPDATGAVALGSYSSATAQGQMDIGSTNTSYGYNSSNYRLITGVYDPQSDHDAATKGYVDSHAATTITNTDFDAIFA